MSIKKQCSKKSKTCKITFTIPSELAKGYQKACLVGCFNSWDVNANPMKKTKKDGSFSLPVELASGKEYQFRYLLDGKVWLNDSEADRQDPTEFPDANNSVIAL